MLFGAIVNSLAIAAGSLAGLFFSRFIPRKHSDTMLKAVAFAIILMGLKMAWQTDEFILLICCPRCSFHCCTIWPLRS